MSTHWSSPLPPLSPRPLGAPGARSSHLRLLRFLPGLDLLPVLPVLSPLLRASRATWARQALLARVLTFSLLSQRLSPLFSGREEQSPCAARRPTTGLVKPPGRQPLIPPPPPFAQVLTFSGSSPRLSPLLRASAVNCLLLAALFFASLLPAQTPVRYDSSTVSGLPARNIGSATMSGRIAAVTAVNDNGRLTVFAGSASGGVWKSVNGGTTFKSVFDSPSAQSIGAVAIDPSNPKIVWAGTGESWVRNSVSIGDGVYKSVDGGENWNNVGLKDSEHIAKILIDPQDGNTVYACATGHLWDDNSERGVYKTSDGGKSWRKVLAGANGSTGCAMLAASPLEPKTIFASLWDFRRQAWTFRSGGPGSGIFKSTDGGEHWTELTGANAKGLPEKPYGRIALAVAPGKPQVVYAAIESKDSALYRSGDGGASWTRLDASQFMVWRPFYFGNLIVDPKDENKVFKVDAVLLLSQQV